MVQHIIFNILLSQKDKRVLIIRKTRTSIRVSTWQLFQDLLIDYGVRFKVNKSLMLITVGSNQVLFAGLDDPEKLKSIEFCNYIWVEEATEITEDDYRQLNLRLRRRTELKNRMWLTCNPISALHWIKLRLVDLKPREFAMDVSTYKDAIEFLDEFYTQSLEDLKHEDPNFYKIYTLGQWGILKNIIYTNWETYDNIPEKVERQSKVLKPTGEVTYGVDWGYTQPHTLVEINWFTSDYFVARELLYASQMTNPDLISQYKTLVEPRQRAREFFAGTDEPASIEDFYKAGFNIQNAETTVRDGINFCKSHLLGFTKDSPDLIKEAQGYKRKEDRQGNVLEEPVKFMDHGMDGMRYGSYTVARRERPNIRTV